MKYKGYTGSVAFDEDAEIFHGEVEGLRDVVTFQGTTVAEIKRAFHESVNDYLEFCASRGESPERPASGKFVLRVPPTTHRLLIAEAKRQKKSLNAYILERLQPA
jgi:predicted HicB family RNase H-like nuclease